MRARVMPAQRPGKSVQEVCTPRDFLDAVRARFGRFEWDLAANKENTITGDFAFYGPGSRYGEDSLTKEWSFHIPDGLLWLNPPYADIAPWAKKCAEESRKGAEIALLIPAAVGTNYFRDFIFQRSRVFFLSPRLTFVGHTQSYPKDLMLCHYGPHVTPGFECWRWRGGK